MNIDKWNNEVLSSQGIRHKAASVKVSRNVGDLQQARLPDDTVVKRQEYIFVHGYGLIRTAPYELHFIFEMPKTFKGWALYCTCGSIAGVVDMSVYSKIASPMGGKILVCIRHTTLKQNIGIGRHADGSTE